MRGRIWSRITGQRSVWWKVNHVAAPPHFQLLSAKVWLLNGNIHSFLTEDQSKLNAAMWVGTFFNKEPRPVTGATKVLLSHRTYFKKKRAKNQKNKKTKHETVASDKKKRRKNKRLRHNRLFFGVCFAWIWFFEKAEESKNAAPDHRQHVLFTCRCVNVKCAWIVWLLCGSTGDFHTQG